MIRGGGSNWTAVAVDEVFSIFFLKTGRTAQFFQNFECSINSLPARFAAQFVQMFLGYSPTRGTHSCAQFSGLNLPGEY